MRNTDKTRDNEQSYQLNRRNLLRAGGATAGIAVSGGIPAATGIDQPVGEADAFAISGSVLAAGAIGLGIGFGGGLAVSEFLDKDVDVEDVKKDARKQSNYDIVETAGISIGTTMQQQADKVGLVKKDSTTSETENYNHSKPNDNPVAHSMTEHATAAVAEAYQAGDSKGDAELAYKQACDIVATTSMWSILGSWNSFVRAISPALISDVGHEFDNIEHAARKYSGHIQGTAYDSVHSMAPLNGVGWTPIGANQYSSIGGPATNISGDWTPIQMRDVSPYLPASVDDMPSDKVPDNGFKVLEFASEKREGGGYGGNTLISPLLDGLSDVSRDDAYLNTLLSDPRQKSLSPRQLKVEYPPTSDVYTIDLHIFGEYIDAVKTIRQNIRSESTTVVDEIYAGLTNDSIDISDILSSRQLYQQNDQSGNYSRAMVALMSYGNLSMPDKGTKTTISVPSGDGTAETTGMLFLDLPADTDLTLKEGDTIGGGTYNTARMLPSDGTPQKQYSSKDITIKSITNADQLSYQSRQRTVASGVDRNKISQRLEETQTRNEQLSQRIEELADDGSGGSDSLLGLGGLGGDSNLILLAGGGLAAYLLGR